MRSHRLSLVFSAGALLAAVFGASAAPAGAFTITPSTWDFGNVAIGQSSPAQAFTVTGQAGDNFAAHPRLLTFVEGQDFFIVSDSCTNVLINGPEDTCSVSAMFTPLANQYVNDQSWNWLMVGPAMNPHAQLLGTGVEPSEGRGEGKSGSPYKGKCKKKKYRKKHERKCRRQKQA